MVISPVQITWTTQSAPPPHHHHRGYTEDKLGRWPIIPTHLVLRWQSYSSTDTVNWHHPRTWSMLMARSPCENKGEKWANKTKNAATTFKDWEDSIDYILFVGLDTFLQDLFLSLKPLSCGRLCEAKSACSALEQADDKSIVSALQSEHRQQSHSPLWGNQMGTDRLSISIPIRRTTIHWMGWRRTCVHWHPPLHRTDWRVWSGLREKLTGGTDRIERGLKCLLCVLG